MRTNQLQYVNCRLYLEKGDVQINRVYEVLENLR